jgi:hypothetical protein
MGGNRNMDELIKRKLDGLEIEPSQLTFNKVQKAYQAQKAGSKASNNNLYWLFMLFGVLLISVITYSLFTNTDNKGLAQVDANSATSSNLVESHSNTTTTNKASTTIHNESITNDNIATNNKSTTTDNTSSNRVTDTEKNNNSGNTTNNSNESTGSNTSTKNTNGIPTTLSSENTENTGNSASSANIEKSSNRTANKNTKATKASSSQSTNTLAENNSTVINNAAKTNNLTKRLKTSKRKSLNLTKTNETESNELNATASKNDGITATDANVLELPQTILQSKSTLQTGEEIVVVSDYLSPLWTKLTSTEKDQSLIPTNDSLARLDLFKDYYKKRINPYYFTLSSEIQMNSITQSVSENTDFNVKVDLPQFNSSSYNKKLAESVSSSTQLNFGGSFLLGFHYQNWGIESGIRFFGFENTTYLKHLPSAYYKRQFSGMIYDTLGNDYDSLYTTTSIRYPFVVNGDTVSPTKYLNTYRFLAIPIRLNYSFHFLKNKILVEPSLGVQVCLPMASSNLVYDKPYNFTYEKSTNQMKPFMQYDGSLKLQYQISRSAGIYVRQGYSFGNQSLYKDAYPLKLSFNSLYTSIGISVTLRK